jgi:hypothetical protein
VWSEVSLGVAQEVVCRCSVEVNTGCVSFRGGGDLVETEYTRGCAGCGRVEQGRKQCALCESCCSD